MNKWILFSLVSVIVLVGCNTAPREPSAAAESKVGTNQMIVRFGKGITERVARRALAGIGVRIVHRYGALSHRGVLLLVEGRGSVEKLARRIAALPGVEAVSPNRRRGVLNR